MIDIANLEAMEPDKLREVAALLGVPVHHRAGKDKMIQDIAEFMLGKPDQKQPVKEEEPITLVSKEELDSIVAPIIREKPDFKYSAEGGIWSFSYNGFVDSGSLNLKPEEIRRKADFVSYHNTVQDIRNAIQPIVDSKEGYDVRFDDVSWTFSYKGASESGNMVMPMKIIVQKAENVSRGARRPRGFDANSGFDTAVGKGYANTVLM